jgi:hypothetical protein
MDAPGVAAMTGDFLAAFPDLRYTFDDLFASSVVRSTSTAVPAPGRTLSCTRPLEPHAVASVLRKRPIPVKNAVVERIAMA